MGGMGVLGAMGVFGSACPNRLTAPKPLCSPPHCLCRPAFAALLCNLCYLCYLCYLCERRPAALLPPPPAPCRRPFSPPLSSLAALPGRAAPKKRPYLCILKCPTRGFSVDRSRLPEPPFRLLFQLCAGLIHIRRPTRNSKTNQNNDKTSTQPPHGNGHIDVMPLCRHSRPRLDGSTDDKHWQKWRL